jgi:two-component system cell cycle sensor histidine kinase/response regulator CckA
MTLRSRIALPSAAASDGIVRPSLTRAFVVPLLVGLAILFGVLTTLLYILFSNPTEIAFWTTALLAVLFASAYGGLLYGLFHKLYVEPVQALRAAAGRAAQGDLADAGIIAQGAEWADLGRSLKRMVAQLRALQLDQFRVVIENAPDAIVMFDQQGEIVEWNCQAERLFGYAHAEAIGSPVSALVHLKAPFMTIEGALQQYRDTGASALFDRSVEDEVQTRQGRPIPAELAVFPVQTAAGLLFCAIVRDTSERVRREQELRAAQRMDAVARFSRGIGYELDSFIMAVDGYVRALQPAVAPDSQAQADLLELRRCSTRAGNLVQQLFALARTRVAQPRTIDCNQLLASMEYMLDTTAGDAIKLETRPESGLWPARADASQFQQIMLIFAGRARAAMPKGGCITIQTANVLISGDTGIDGAVPPGAYVMVAISDTGFGLDERTIAHLFEPYSLAHESGSSGLELGAAYGMIKQAHGHLRVSSTPERGSIFRIYLPRVEQSPVVIVEPLAAVGSPKETILLAEDEDQVRRLIERALKQRGYNVLSATNGAESLRISSEYDGTIHLLLTDVVMPEMGGRESAERMRLERPDVKVIFMSGYSEELVRLQGDLTESAAFIAKPFSPDELRRLVREVLDSVAATS